MEHDELLACLRDPASGTRLGQDEYGHDFGDRLWLADGADTWKLERMQFYDETGFPGWDAFTEGDWDRSMEMYETLRPRAAAGTGLPLRNDALRNGLRPRRRARRRAALHRPRHHHRLRKPRT
jgi:hypothetical protein